MSPSTFLYLVKKLSKLWSDFGRILVEGDSIVGFQKFLVFLTQRLEPNNNVPKHFSLSRQKIIEILVGFWSRAIALSDFNSAAGVEQQNIAQFSEFLWKSNF